MANIISEGGAAAVALIQTKLQKHPDNKNRKLEPSKISDSDIPLLLPEKFGVMPSENDGSYIGKILFVLSTAGLIEPDSPPTFSLGSSRLAALKYYGPDSVYTDKYETDDVISMASQKKTDYGDLDIDVSFTGDKQDIANMIESINPSVFATKVTGEIHVAIRVGDRVFQIDLVDFGDNPESQKFLQKSSFLDLAAEVKGVFSIFLLRSIASVMETDSELALSSLDDFAADNPNNEFSEQYTKRIKLGYRPVGFRFTLNNGGLVLVLDLQKPSPKDPNNMMKAKIPFDIEPRIGYGNLDDLAKAVLNSPKADGSVLLHATKLADFIGDNFEKDKAHAVWKNFREVGDRVISKSVSEESYKIGMNTIADLMNIDKGPESLYEGREAIGRFEGKNKFKDSTMLEVLYSLVSESGNEGNQSFTIDVGSNPAIDIVEKMDSMFINFGIDDDGEFFMESSNSGPVKSSDVKDKFGFSKDLFGSFKYLESNQSFQLSLQRIFKTAGPFKYDAELFPILTHKGSEDGGVVFVATRYKKEKFGKNGGFVVFKANLWDEDTQNWYRPEPQANIKMTDLIKHESVSNKWGHDWNVYTNEEDMKISGIIRVGLTDGLTRAFASESAFNNALDILTSRKKSVQKSELIEDMEVVREKLQNALNEFANQSRSRLGDADSYIEGVVLRIKRSNGDIYEVKGTSTTFDGQKDILWKDRVNIMNIEKALEDSVMKNILMLKTSQPAALNRHIKKANEDFQPDPKKNETINKALFLRNLVPYVAETPQIIDYDEVKPKLKALLETMFDNLEHILSSFKNNASSLDPDSADKTVEFAEKLKEKLLKYTQIGKSTATGESFYLILLGTVLERRITNLTNFASLGKSDTENTGGREKVILWNGRAQPWHVGHHAMVEKGKSLLPKVGADKVVLMIVRGGKSSQDKVKNPLSEEEQIQLLRAIYDDDPDVVIAEESPKGIFQIFDLLTDMNVIMKGWLAGADRFASYNNLLKGFNTERFLMDHDYSPILMNSEGIPDVQLIETPRLMSGTEARETAKQLQFNEWLAKVAPQGISDMAVQAYYQAYIAIRGEVEDFNDTVDEISAMVGGAVSGYSGVKDEVETLIREGKESKNMIDRKQFLEEEKLRKLIRKAIIVSESKKVKQKKEVIEEESKLRSYIRKMIKEAQEDHPHSSTGINVLQDLLKKIIPVFEVDFKSLTTDVAQRQSFRSHIVKAVQNTLAPSKAHADAEISAPSDEMELEEIYIQEDEVDISIGDDEGKFIDIDGDGIPDAEEEVDDFSIEGEDETGRNVAATSFQKVEKSIQEAYGILSNEKDRSLFYEYLITNLKLYFDKFEDELSTSVEEPQSQEYDKVIDKEDGEVSQDMGQKPAQDSEFGL